MLLQKTALTALMIALLASTACSTTKNHSVTSKPVPQALLVMPQRPEPPQNGSQEAILTHAVAFGRYVKNLENQLRGWIDWAMERKP
ncbi:hypothetical protein BWP33_10775 [Simonsiella muelleri ATCC 29453]|nr:hypothetical protein BWP33_02650 [Simonsiella muelleri ATCC 29453]AUX61894.1 hypothetical protein BWP33_08820 [Simonsiella muelleri ATCC 29453]AUX62243.1 hypothetical protein BWP33_10775 [Simonsiella muelleri ATCC 29453]